MTITKVNNINPIKTSHISTALKTSAALLGTIALAGSAVCAAGMRKFENKAYKANFLKFELIPALQNKCKVLNMKTKNNRDFKLLDINPDNHNRYIIFCNGMFTQQDAKNQKLLSILTKTDYGIAGFEYPGRGESLDKFSQKDAQQSLETVYQYLINKGIKKENIGLVAHSMGCAVAGEFASKNNVKFLVLLSPFNKAKDMVKHFVSRSENFPKLLKTTFKKIPSFLIPLKNKFDNEKYLKKVNCPMLIIASKDDQTVPVKLSQKLKNKLSDKKIEYKEFLNGGHDINFAKLKVAMTFIGNHQ